MLKIIKWSEDQWVKRSGHREGEAVSMEKIIKWYNILKCTHVTYSSITKF